MSAVYSIEDLQEFAKNKQWLLLSTTYINNRTKLFWQCSLNHTWFATWGSIHKLHTGCPVCSGLSKPSIAEIQLLASSRGGSLLSTVYVNSQTKLLWQCGNGHQWEAKYGDIKNKPYWCRQCSNRVKPNIQKLQQFTLLKGGKLLSNKYSNNKAKLNWECCKGHIWSARWKDVNVNDSWCPECSSFKTENQVKQLLENKLGIVFIKTRFTYNGNRYEFDGFNEERKIAFEYHGIQHYVYPNYWHKTENIFLKAQQRDRDKEQYCIDNGIKLIVIPYTIKNLESHISILSY